MTHFTYTPIRDGGHIHNGVVIAVDKNTLGLCKEQSCIKLQIHELPANWRLCEGIEDEAPPVPVEDIERILREHDAAYGYRTDSNLLVRRVQRWLDSVPRESKATDEQR